MESISFSLCFSILACFLFSSAEIFPATNRQLEKETSYWMNEGRKEIQNALNRPMIDKKAKNVIFFLGDGLGITANTAGRIYTSQKVGMAGEENLLVWETLPNVGLLKTYNLDRQVPDSAATATAFLCGVKANYKTIGVNGKVAVDDCTASLDPETHVSSILEWAQMAGKDTGIVTTTRLTHATPAVTYAHSSNREWECDAKVPEESKVSCKDIARQLIEDEPGKNINVIFGGGRRSFGAALPEDDGSSCLREDDRNLVADWQKDKTTRGFSHAYATNKEELDDIDVLSEDFMLGIFSGSHLPYELDRNVSSPSLADLTEVAIKRLRRNREGFVLLVEGGRIDHALHDTKTKYFLEEIDAMNMAVQRALNLVSLEDTLLLVTADHSHVVTINGYPERGNDILGLVTNNEDIADGLPMPTLMFTNGVGFNFTYNGTHVTRLNYSNVDTTHKDFISPALVPTVNGAETHGGEDVAVYAAGPMSHLFHKVHEQSYVAHVVGYAACMGPYHEECSQEESIQDPKSPGSVYHLKYDDEGLNLSMRNVSSFWLIFICFVILYL